MPGVEATMREFKRGTLHSGSAKGPKVTSRKQAVAIALSEQRKRGKTVATDKPSSGSRKMKMTPKVLGFQRPTTKKKLADARKTSKPVPLGGVKKSSTKAKKTGGLAKKTAKKMTPTNIKGFAYGRKTV